MAHINDPQHRKIKPDQKREYWKLNRSDVMALLITMLHPAGCLGSFVVFCCAFMLGGIIGLNFFVALVGAVFITTVGWYILAVIINAGRV